jgi:hypothetical protein
MKKRVQNKMKMYDIVRTVMMENQSAWSENQGFEAGVEQFNVLLADLKLAGSGQAMRTKGLKTHQLIYINDVVSKSMVLKNALAVYAYDNGLSSISESLNFSEGKLKKSPQTQLRILLLKIAELAEVHISELQVYGVTDMHLQAFLQSLEQHEQEMVAIRKGVIERKAFTMKISNFEKALDVVMVKKLDVLIRLMKVEHPQFFEDYKNARILIDQKKGSSTGSPPTDKSGEFGIAS